MLKEALLAVLLAGSLSAAVVPAGTELELRLTSKVSSTTSKSRDAFQAVVIAPAVAGGSIAIGPGAKVAGHVKVAKPAEAADQQAVLELSFNQLEDSKGTAVPIIARLAAVDNARESVDKDGRILGIIASKTGSARLNQGINKVAEKYPGLAELLSTAKKSVVAETDASISYQPGVEMTIELTKPLDWTGRVTVPKIAAITPEADLSRLVNSEPFLTRAERPPKRSDITNLMFFASEEELIRAFEAAGWSQAKQSNGESKLETFRAMVEDRGYKEAPVSILLLDGRPPELAFEKLNNTFAARHHLRIWRRPGLFHGKPIWVSSSTHDTGIDFSDENRTFIHKIDPNIDRERAKVVNDLLFTGMVKALALVDRPAVPTKGYNATGDQLLTDGRMAVLSF
jgi:hypothetical protein